MGVKLYIAFYRYRWIFISVFLFITLLMFVGITKIKVSPYFKQGAKSEYSELRKRYSGSSGMADVSFILVKLNGKDYLREVERIDGMISNLKNTSFVINPLKFGKDAENLLRDFGLLHVDENDVFILFLVGSKEYGNASHEQLREIERILEMERVEYYILSTSYLELKSIEYVVRILRYFPLIASLMIFLIFYFRIRSNLSTIVSLIPAISGSIWIMGMYGWIGKNITLENVLIPVITIIIGSAYGMHFVTHYIKFRDRCGIVEAMKKTVGEVGIPILLSTLTTTTGFLSLLFTDSPSMREFGLSTAIGIFLVFLCSMLFLPSFSTFLKPMKSIGLGFRIFHRTIPFLMSRKAVVLFLILVFSISPFIYTIKVEFSPTRFFKGNTDIGRSLRTIERLTGYTIPVFAMLKFDKDPLSSDISSRVLKLEDELVKRGLAYRTFSVYSMLRALSKNIGFNIAGFLSLRYMVRLRNAIPIEKLLNIGDRSIRIFIFPRNDSTKTLKEIERLVMSFNTGAVEKKIWGFQYEYMEANEKLVENQLKSLSFALFTIYLMMILTMRNIVVGTLTMIPVLGMLLFVFGFMGILKIDLNVITSYVANIAIGAGIDYSIHLSYTYLKESEGKKSTRAMFRTLSITGTAIIANAFGIGAGFLSLYFSPMKIHTDVGILMFISMVISSIFTLLFLPRTILKTVGEIDLRKMIEKGLDLIKR